MSRSLAAKLRVVGQLELAQPMRLQAVRPPDALHRTDADADRLGHRRRGPVRRLARRRPERERHHALGDLRRQRRDARRARLVAQQPVHALLHEALLPAPDGGLGHAGLPHDLGRAAAFGGQQHDPGAPDVLLRAVAVDGDSEQAARGRQAETSTMTPVRMPPTCTPTRAGGIPKGLDRQISSTSCTCCSSR